MALGRGRGVGSWQTMAGGRPSVYAEGRGSSASSEVRWPLPRPPPLSVSPSAHVLPASSATLAMLGLPAPNSHLLRGGSDSILMLPTALHGSHCLQD